MHAHSKSTPTWTAINHYVWGCLFLAHEDALKEQIFGFGLGLRALNDNFLERMFLEGGEP